jgi:hypothetical protein
MFSDELATATTAEIFMSCMDHFMSALAKSLQLAVH